MTRDDIIRMALEAGFLDRKESCPLSGESRFDEEICVGEYPVGEIVERFASLVAAAEREVCASIIEECCEHCAATIRAMGDE